MSDIRAGGVPKVLIIWIIYIFSKKALSLCAYDLLFWQDPKLYDKFCGKHGEQLEEKSLTICSGVDYTNINYQHVVCPDAATAKVIIYLKIILFKYY